jgi:hypothetical protein
MSEEADRLIKDLEQINNDYLTAFGDLQSALARQSIPKAFAAKNKIGKLKKTASKVKNARNSDACASGTPEQKAKIIELADSIDAQIKGNSEMILTSLQVFTGGDKGGGLLSGLFGKKEPKSDPLSSSEPTSSES